MEFNWKISTDSLNWEFSKRSRRLRFLNESVNLSTSKEGSSSCQCTMTLMGRNEEENCIANAPRVTGYARRFTRGHWSILGPGSEEKWCGTHTHQPNREWDETVEGMMLNFPESIHPVLRVSSALERGELESKGRGVKSIHFNLTPSNLFFEQLFPSISSVSTEQ